MIHVSKHSLSYTIAQRLHTFFSLIYYPTLFLLQKLISKPAPSLTLYKKSLAKFLNAACVIVALLLTLSLTLLFTAYCLTFDLIASACSLLGGVKYPLKNLWAYRSIPIFIRKIINALDKTKKLPPAGEFLNEVYLLLPFFIESFIKFLADDEQKPLLFFKFNVLLDEILKHGTFTDEQRLLLGCNLLCFFHSLFSNSIPTPLQVKTQLFIKKCLGMMCSNQHDLFSHIDFTLKPGTAKKQFHRIVNGAIKKTVKKNRRNKGLLNEVSEQTAIAAADFFHTLFVEQSGLLSQCLEPIPEEALLGVEKKNYLQLIRCIAKNRNFILEAVGHYLEKTNILVLIQFFFTSYLYLDLKELLKEKVICEKLTTLLLWLLDLHQSVQPVTSLLLHHALTTYTQNDLALLSKFIFLREPQSFINLIQPSTVTLIQNPSQFHQLNDLLLEINKKFMIVKESWFFSKLILELIADCSSYEGYFLLHSDSTQCFKRLQVLVPTLTLNTAEERMDLISLFKKKGDDALPLFLLSMLYHSTILILDKSIDDFESVMVLRHHNQLFREKLQNKAKTIYEDCLSLLAMFDLSLKPFLPTLKKIIEFVIAKIPYHISRDITHERQSHLTIVEDLANQMHHIRSKSALDTYSIDQFYIRVLNTFLEETLTKEDLHGTLVMTRIFLLIKMRSFFIQSPSQPLESFLNFIFLIIEEHLEKFQLICRSHTHEIVKAVRTKKIMPLVCTFSADPALLILMNQQLHNYLNEEHMHTKDFDWLLDTINKNIKLRNLPMAAILRKLRESTLCHNELLALSSICVSLAEIFDEMNVFNAVYHGKSIFNQMLKLVPSHVELLKSSTSMLIDYAITRYDPPLTYSNPVMLIHELSATIAKKFEATQSNNYRVINVFHLAQKLLVFNKQYPESYEQLNKLFSLKHDSALTLQQKLVDELNPHIKEQEKHLISLFTHFHFALKAFTFYLFEATEPLAQLAESSKEDLNIFSILMNQNKVVLTTNDHDLLMMIIKQALNSRMNSLVH